MNTVPRYRVALVRESGMTFSAYPRFSNSQSCFEAFLIEIPAPMPRAVTQLGSHTLNDVLPRVR
jgi:hypothetical protein